MSRSDPQLWSSSILVETPAEPQKLSHHIIPVAEGGEPLPTRNILRPKQHNKRPHSERRRSLPPRRDRGWDCLQWPARLDSVSGLGEQKLASTRTGVTPPSQEVALQGKKVPSNPLEQSVRGLVLGRRGYVRLSFEEDLIFILQCCRKFLLTPPL